MTGGLVLDLVLLAAVVAFAASGFRRGFVVGVLSLLGFVGGAALGATLAPSLLSQVQGSGAAVPLLGLLVVLLVAALGQVLAAAIGSALRSRIDDRAGQVTDAALGALLSGVGVLALAWFLGSLVVLTPFSGVAGAARSSVVLAAVDAVVPDEARTAFSSLRREIETTDFPQVFGQLGEPDVPDVPVPDPGLTDSPVVAAARPSTVQVAGVAPQCRRGVEGSGFVYAPGRVMTNAHVVAGVVEPTVTVPGGPTLPARVVQYDPGRDLAVLAVDGLDAAPLPLGGEVDGGDDVLVLGYPGGGPFTVSPGRVRAEISAQGPDIYNERIVVRDVYAVRADVRAGSSGGPMLSGTGDVVGVVFAASSTDPETGYALTAAEAAPVAEAGRSATGAVSTGGCD